MEGAFGVNSICGTPGPEGRVNLCRSLGRVRFKGAVPEPAGGRSRKTRVARPGRRDPCSPAPPGPDPRSSDPRPHRVPISGTPLRDPPLPFPAPGAQTSTALGTSALWSPHPTPPHRALAALVLDRSRCPRPRPQLSTPRLIWFFLTPIRLSAPRPSDRSPSRPSPRSPAASWPSAGALWRPAGVRGDPAVARLRLRPRGHLAQVTSLSWGLHTGGQVCAPPSSRCCPALKRNTRRRPGLMSSLRKEGT